MAYRIEGLNPRAFDRYFAMTDAELARAFEPFFTTKANGTGLGLPTCREVMARHGGDVRLTSAPGHGTTATLVFPPPAA